MGRIRTIKPDFFQHEELFHAEFETGLPLRVAYMGLVTQCDRAGRFKWRPQQLKHAILPYDELDMEVVLNSLAFYGFVKKYEIESVLYGCVPTFGRHQFNLSKESQSYLPDPCPDSELSIDADTVVPKKSDKQKSAKASVTNQQSETLLLIFKFWQATLSHPYAKLDNKRKKVIEQALKLGYSSDQICMAIKGCSLTPYNMGNNESGQRFDSLGLILRDAEHIDRFLHNAQYPPKPKTAQQRCDDINEQVLNAWMDEKTGNTTIVPNPSTDIAGESYTQHTPQPNQTSNKRGQH